MQETQGKAGNGKKPFIPQEFTDKYTQILGQEAGAFFECCNRKIPKSIWVNSLKIRPQLLAKDLGKKGWNLVQLPFHENAFALEGVERPGGSDEFNAGLFNLQEKASMIPALALDLHKGDVALDACAAPGNKTLQVACLLNGAGKVVAADKNVERFRSLRFNIRKFGMGAIAKRMDILDAKRKGVVDRILLDAPCSSEGLVRKDPDALRNWSMELVQKKASLQKKLADKCLELLKPDGVMVYSTCSFAPEEDEEVVQHLLDGAKARIEAIKIKGFKMRGGMREYNGARYDASLAKTARIYPQDNDTQQFFVAKIRKIST
ncbi:MAG TPA: RsmB/NOP family class I SAM-dependent RNA methyltransferase [Candidatus Diapherotrites archaeon]|uniref:RsmB/NOP family class I SAM-dependent RNA methyltransferase n=1 Tax=Candidatus Iainarchaeum sp. TaxID=3101447 RepID=A0A7J4J045_9ARCH|nr:RsmB/NOP family class I SAM-dependent RNA methyltransferase [Candidatus Diapherotrites archaeon]